MHLKKWRSYLRRLGPGLVTGAADDDPSGIATYSQTGAQFGYGQLWTAIFMLPLMIAIQESCTRIGAVHGKGLVAVIKDYFPSYIVNIIVFLLVMTNTINIGADIGAMAAAAALIVKIPYVVLTFIFAAGIICALVLIPYRTFAKYLKWFCLSFLAYPLTLIIIDAPWSNIISATFIPHIEFNKDFLIILSGVFGTTISPYLFFWQPAQEVEEERAHHVLNHLNRSHLISRFIRLMRVDNFIGMLFSQISMWSIIVVTGTVLHTHGITDIQTATDAAEALEPLVQQFPHSGLLAKLIFALGIIGFGCISIPVLAGSSAYALSDIYNWPEGLQLKFSAARSFYSVIIISTLIGLIVNFVGISPMKALVYTAVINSLVAIPLILVIGILGSRRSVMGEYKNGLLSQTFIWLTFSGMLVTAIAMLISLF